MTRLTTVNKFSTWLSRVVAVILALLPFHALLTTWAGSNLGHLDIWRSWKELLFLIMVPPAVWLIWQDSKLKNWLVRSWIVRFFGIYVLLHLVLGAVAYANNEVNTAALAYSFVINLRFIGFFILCMVVAAHSNFLIRHWPKILLIPAGAVVVFGLLQKFLLPYDFLRHFGYGKATIPAFHTIDNDPNLLRIQSTLRGPNPLGAYLVLILSTLLTFLRNLRVVPVGLGAFFGAMVVLLYSHSRSAWVGFAFALITFGLLSFSHKIKTWLTIMGISLLVLVGGIYLFRSSDTVEETFFHDSPSVAAPQTSNEARTESLKRGALDVIHEPLGRGPGTAGPASARNSEPARISENYFLQIGQEVGIIGVAVFIAINTLLVKQLWKKRDEQLAKILIASFAGLTFINLLSHAWTDDTVSYIWWGLAGVSIATPAVVSKKLSVTSRAKRN